MYRALIASVENFPDAELLAAVYRAEFILSSIEGERLGVWLLDAGFAAIDAEFELVELVVEFQLIDGNSQRAYIELTIAVGNYLMS